MDESEEASCQTPSASECAETFEDSAAAPDDTQRQLIEALGQCRQHIDEIDREAACMEQLLCELVSTAPQRQHVLDAVQRLDGLRRRINSTQARSLVTTVNSVPYERYTNLTIGDKFRNFVKWVRCNETTTVTTTEVVSS